LPAAFLTARFYLHWKRDNWDWATSLAAAQRWLRDSTDGEKAEFAHPRDGISLLPVTARRPLWRAVASRDPAGRSFAHIADWAAYTFVGGTAHEGGSSAGS
jgi:CHAT domain-containing protein